MVHRDVKPENILISLAENAGKAKAKLADFGLSKVQASPDGVFSNSGYKGTRCWSAPELLFTNREPFTYAIDIFSLGCVYGYCLNNGNHPFGDENNFGNICRNVQEERIVWSSEATEVDDSLKTLVSRMTLYNAEFRATLKMDAESLATDFERLEDFFEPYFPAEVMDKTSEDYQALLEVIVGTAVGEEKLTQVGLAWLVRNRTQYPGRWLSTLAGVCRQRNQFCRHGNISEALKSDEAVREIDAWLPSVYRDHSDVTDGANHCFPIMGNGGIANTPPSHFNPDAPFRDIGNLRFFRA